LRTWADIRFDAFAANLAALARRLAAGSRLLLPVKADAYGHGAATIARWAEELGVGWFGVAVAEEAALLRSAGVRGRILLFGPLPEEGLAELRDLGTTPTLCSLEEARRWARVAPGAAAHVEVDTGMGRAGFDWRRTAELSRLADVADLSLEAAYTHFAAADADPAFTDAQEERFRRVLAELEAKGLSFTMTHLSNSAALLRRPPAREDLARPGIAAYGATRSTGAPPEAARELRPVLAWWARVVQVRDFEPGDSVGYGRDVRLATPTRGALLAVGYGDGYPRSQAAGGFVLLAARSCPVLGRVSMDLTMVDASGVPQIREGDAALLLGDSPGLTADDLAARSGTISYEILTGIRRRVERRPVRELPSGAAEPGARGAVHSA
jgi:alanine racemase